MVELAADADGLQLVSVDGRRLLAVPLAVEGFDGEPAELEGRSVRLVEQTPASAAAVRTLSPHLRPRALGTTPSFGTRPAVGRWPTTPQKQAGIRTDPAVSVPSVPAARSAAAATPLPPDEPPAMRSWS